MPVGPQRLHRVTADDGAAQELKRPRRERLGGRLVNVAQDVRLTLAARTWTVAAEFFHRDEALAPILPLDGEFIADGLDVGRAHVWVSIACRFIAQQLPLYQWIRRLEAEDRREGE